jgi:glycine/D-amino acid oxidase-like deaminating enzyme
MKISIVGAGIMGLGTAWALERLGHQVTIFEQGPIPNPLASSHDSHRLIRFAYGDKSGYMCMVGDAYAMWQRLWVDLGETLYHETGTLALAGGATRWLHDSAEALARAGHALERLDSAALAHRFPLLRAENLAEGFYLPSGGVLLAGRILEALARRLAARGVELRPNTPVRGIDPDRGWVTLTDGTVAGADAVLVAAGPWIARLVPGLRHRVTPSRQILAYVEPPAPLAAAWCAMPMLLDIDAEAGFYAVPPVAGTGLKFGDHRFVLGGDPDLAREAAMDEAADLLAAGRHRLHQGESYRIASLKTCFYTVEPTERLIVEPLGIAGWVMSPCSGHGFKFGPLLGSAVAGAIDSGEAGDITLWAAGETA